MDQITLRALRVNKGWTLDEASIKMGVSKDTLSNWERGETLPNVAQVKRIEEIYNISYDRINFLLDNNGLTDN